MVTNNITLVDEILSNFFCIFSVVESNSDSSSSIASSLQVVEIDCARDDVLHSSNSLQETFVCMGWKSSNVDINNLASILVLVIVLICVCPIQSADLGGQVVQLCVLVLVLALDWRGYRSVVFWLSGWICSSFIKV